WRARAVRRQQRAGRTTGSRRRARSRTTRRARATTAPRSSLDAAIATAKHRGAAHAWGDAMSAGKEKTSRTDLSSRPWGEPTTGSGDIRESSRNRESLPLGLLLGSGQYVVEQRSGWLDSESLT